MKRAIAIILCLLASGELFACDCRHSDLKDVYDRYDLVFRGTVDAVGSKWIWEKGRWLPTSLRKVKFEGLQLYKADNGAGTPVFTHPETAACGYTFEKGREYIVFAYLGTKEWEEKGLAVDGGAMVSACGHTLDVEVAREHYEEHLEDVLRFLGSASGS